MIVKKVFSDKSYSADIYKWSPQSNDKTIKIKPTRPYYCNATTGSNGQDWISTYAFNLVLVNDDIEKIAYVECDYVK